MDESDTGWSTCKEDWERLRWARGRIGLTQEEFAQRVGMKRGAYIKYEARPGSSTGHTPLKFEQARPWSRPLKVRWEWLLDGAGLPWLSDEKALSQEVLGLAERIEEQPDEMKSKVMTAIRNLLDLAG